MTYLLSMDEKQKARPEGCVRIDVKAALKDDRHSALLYAARANTIMRVKSKGFNPPTASLSWSNPHDSLICELFKSCFHDLVKSTLCQSLRCWSETTVFKSSGKPSDGGS